MKRVGLVFRIGLAVCLLAGVLGLTPGVSARRAAASSGPAMFLPTVFSAYTRPPLTIWVDSQMSAVFRSLAPAFRARYKTDLVVVEKSWIVDDFIAETNNSAGPDLIFVVSEDSAKLVNNHLVSSLDLSGMSKKLLPQAVEDFSFAGVTYGAPLYVENLALLYNRALVSEPPTTWDELFSVGRQLMDSGYVAYCLAFSDLTFHIQPFFSAYNGYIFGFDSLGDYNPLDLGLDSTQVISATNRLVSEIDSRCMSPIKGWDTTHVQFQTAQTPFLITGPWALNRLRSSEMPYGIANIPSGGQPWVRAYGLMLNKKAPNRGLALDFLRDVVMTDITMDKIATAADRPSAWELAYSPYDDQDLASFRMVAQTGLPLPNIEELNYVWAPWNQAMIAIYNKTKTPESALTEAAAKIRADIAKAGLVNVVGNFQIEAGCTGTWQADCPQTYMTRALDAPHFDSGPYSLPAGNYTVLVAVGGSMTTNYGAGGQLFGPTIAFNLAVPTQVSFSWDPYTHILTVIY